MPAPETIRLGQVVSRLAYGLSRDAVYAAAVAALLPEAPLQIHVGTEPAKDPKHWHTPSLLIFPQDRRAGDADRDHSCQIIVELRITDRREDTDAAGEIPLIEHPGVYRLDRLTALTAQAMRRAVDSSPVDLDELREQVEVEAWYPIMGAMLTLEVRSPQMMGAAYVLPSPRTPVALVASAAALSVAADGTVDLQLRIDQDVYSPLPITATITGNAELSVAAGATLSYTTADWSTLQTITIAATALATGSATLTLAPATAATHPVAPLTIPISVI